VSVSVYLCEVVYVGIQVHHVGVHVVAHHMLHGPQMVLHVQGAQVGA
jgi:hypothetical protein